MTTRAQSHVVGVAVLVGITVVALATVTAGVGTIVESNAAASDATRVAAALDDTLDPVEATGVNRGAVSFVDGELRIVERTLRVLDESGVVARVRVDAVVFVADEHRVEYVAGAIVRDEGSNARVVEPPPITASREADVLAVGAPKLNASRWAVSGSGGVTVGLRTDTTHERTDLGNGTYRVAIETGTPSAWESFFEGRGATVESRDRRFEPDEAGSVVARFPDERVGYVVVHDMRLEVTHA